MKQLVTYWSYFKVDGVMLTLSRDGRCIPTGFYSGSGFHTGGDGWSPRNYLTVGFYSGDCGHLL